MKRIFTVLILCFGLAPFFFLLAQDASTSKAESIENTLDKVHNVKIANDIRKWIGKDSFDYETTKILVPEGSGNHSTP
jgi:hypothetical protein